MRSWIDWELVQGLQRVLRLLPLRPSCRAVNVTKATLEGLFADELTLLQPTPGYMRLLKESVLQIWKARKAAVREEIATAERTAKAIREKLDRLGEAFLFERSIDIRDVRPPR